MLGTTLTAPDYLLRVHQELSRLDVKEIEAWSEVIYNAWQNKRFVFVFGNGGSGTTASHIAEDLGKSLIPNDRLMDDAFPRLKILSLTDNAGWIMAVGNDLSYEQIFVQQLRNYASPGDVALAISGSGNSPNVLRAVEWANEHGLVTFGLTGYSGGKLKQIQQQGFHAPLNDMGMVESIHLTVFHWVLNDVYARINKAGRYA